jgi:hypothetical protein
MRRSLMAGVRLPCALLAPWIFGIVAACAHGEPLGNSVARQSEEGGAVDAPPLPNPTDESGGRANDGSMSVDASGSGDPLGGDEPIEHSRRGVRRLQVLQDVRNGDGLS